MAPRNQDAVEEDVVFRGRSDFTHGYIAAGEMTPQVPILRALPRLFQSGFILEAARCLDQTFPSKWTILATKSLESRELHEIVNGENRRQFFLVTPEK